VPSVGESWADQILRHLSDIGRGQCAISDATIEAEPNLELRQILLGHLILHEDLLSERAQREEAVREQARISAEQRRLTVGLERALEARDQFLAIASHELRTPITTLLLQLECVKLLVGRNRGGELEELKARHLPVLRRQVDRLTALIMEMLDVARINTGRLELQPAPVELCDLVAEVVERFEPEVARRRVALHVTLARPVAGRWDAARLDQVITNLLSNAFRYGEGRPIDVSVRRDGGRALLAVRDRGIGISLDDQKRIFSPFTRAVSSDHIAGLGLGLWIAHEIVEASGGQIRVESAPGAGSTFTVELPVAA
jgi:signal transduction histidine kinase